MCPNYLVGSAVIGFKMQNQGESEQTEGQRAQRFYYFSYQIVSFTQYDQLDSKSQQVEGFACGVMTTA